MEEVVAGRKPEAQKMALLLGLKMKGETVEERRLLQSDVGSCCHSWLAVQGAMDTRNWG